MANVDENSDISFFIKDIKGISFDPTKNKIVCSYNGHEMPCTESAVRTFINGKKYKALKTKHDSELLDKYKQHLVPSNKRATKNQLFCKLTLRHLNSQPHHIERHVNGKRFQKALARWEECQKSGVEFKPRNGQSRKRKESDSDSIKSSNSLFGKMNLASDSDGGPPETMDDMEDLYPPEDFNNTDESEGSDLEPENMPELSKQQNTTAETPTEHNKPGEKRKSNSKQAMTSAVPEKRVKPDLTDVKKKSKKQKQKSKKIKQKSKTEKD